MFTRKMQRLPATDEAIVFYLSNCLMQGDVLLPSYQAWLSWNHKFKFIALLTFIMTGDILSTKEMTSDDEPKFWLSDLP